MTNNEHIESSKLEKFLIDGVVVLISAGLIGAAVYITRPLPKIRDLPSANIAVTNVDYSMLISNDVNRIAYEQLEIKPYEK